MHLRDCDLPVDPLPLPLDPFPLPLTGLGLGVSTAGGWGVWRGGSGMSTEMSLKGSCAVDV